MITKDVMNWTNPVRIQPTPEPEQPGPWTTIAHKLWRVISVLASLAMVYLVWTIVAAKLI